MGSVRRTVSHNFDIEYAINMLETARRMWLQFPGLSQSALGRLDSLHAGLLDVIKGDVFSVPCSNVT